MLPAARGKIHDDILRRLVPIQEVVQHEDAESQSNPPKSRAEKLLEAVDSSTFFDKGDLDDTDSWDMEGVPGGQITYVFERRSDSTL